MELEIKFLFSFFILFSIESFAMRTTGYVTLGVATTTERFSTSDFGSDKNDALFSSQRIFCKTSEIGADMWETIADVRNKYDAFDKLNKELYQLDPRDEFQIRQLSGRMANPDGKYSPIIGRFNVSEAGSVFVDGAGVQYRLTSDWYSGLFAGMNPKRADKSYLVSDSKATGAGLYLTYQKKTTGWDTNRYLTHGFVQQRYGSETERQFLFHNGVYQWQADSRIISLAYFDFVPRSYVQTLYFVYQQSLGNYIFSEIGQLNIDALEYQRRQDILEKLDPSSYKESHAGFEYRITPDNSLFLSYSAGERSVDQLKRTEISMSYRLQNIISKNWDTQFKLANRKNFTSQDNILYWNLGYFSKDYEATVDIDYATQKNDDGTTTHPINTELGLTSFFAKKFFTTVVLQRAADETVTILGTFFKIGYRFGNKELLPIHDGAAPRGSL